MATGKPPWSQQYQEVAALFHIGTTKSHPPIPEYLSSEAKDFLLKCLQKEPNSRPAASELLQHPFVTGEDMVSHPPSCAPVVFYLIPSKMSTCSDTTDICEMASLHCSTGSPGNLLDSRFNWKGNSSDDDMCQIDDKDDVTVSGVKLNSLMSDDFKSYNPVSEPSDEWECKFNESSEREYEGLNLETEQQIHLPTSCPEILGDVDKDFSFPCGPSLSEDEDELTESKIAAFLGEKALELKKLQTPLYEEFFNSLNAVASPTYVESISEETTPRYLKLPPKSRSPSRGPVGSPSGAVDSLSTGSPGSNGRPVSSICNAIDQTLKNTPSPPPSNMRGLAVDAQQEPNSPSMSYSERQRKWKEELDQELERKREMMRQAGAGGKTLSPKDRALNRQRTRFASPGS
ncbi:hypothetical protein G4B88_000632 [Cannabis sativa]|uniref:Protein kinase domain-containing protein n=1 Tax=Cannabis sativa TaxID=3483 RepID=A0A7J6ES16_CANSA|nr:hypothetical protein G4B88_000632 [Cannabis sativa]